MHKINVLSIGSENFNTSLEELKEYFSFKLTTSIKNLDNKIIDKFDVLIFHEECYQNNSIKKSLLEVKKIKILAFNSKNLKFNNFTNKLLLPTTIKDLNQIVNNSIMKKNFSKNSSIKIKDYILDKNNKRLTKNKDFVKLTEKEIQLLELFLSDPTSISKSLILEKVWKYATDVDTHTVETHIYRLRKKIKSKFSDETFILNDKGGYSL